MLTTFLVLQFWLILIGSVWCWRLLGATKEFATVTHETTDLRRSQELETLTQEE